MKQLSFSKEGFSLWCDFGGFAKYLNIRKMYKNHRIALMTAHTEKILDGSLSKQ
jgi:hypothetical protein